MRYHGRTLRPEYTDLALVVGPNLAWVEDDYEDLQRTYPEVLLGYRIRLMTVQQVAQGRVHGMRPTKVIWLDGCERNPFWKQARNVLQASTAVTPFGRVEEWHVHRGCGVERVG